MASRRWERARPGLVGAVALAVLSLFAWYKRLPEGFEWPVFLAPVLTVFIAFCTFWDYMHEDEWRCTKNGQSISDTCVLGMVFAFALCMFLASFQGWFWHLVIVGLLFLTFIWWDCRMLSLINSRNHRENLTRTSLLINRPTVIGVFVALGGLLIISWVRGLTVDLGFHRGFSEKDPRDTFVAGLISFHLVVASSGYLAGSRGETGDVQGRMGKLLHRLLREVPAGPEGAQENMGETVDAKEGGK